MNLTFKQSLLITQIHLAAHQPRHYFSTQGMESKERLQLVYVDESGIDNREDFCDGWNPKRKRSEYPVVILPIYNAALYNVNPKPVLHWVNSCQKISDHCWSQKSDIYGGALHPEPTALHTVTAEVTSLRTELVSCNLLAIDFDY